MKRLRKKKKKVFSDKVLLRPFEYKKLSSNYLWICLEPSNSTQEREMKVVASTLQDNSWLGYESTMTEEELKRDIKVATPADINEMVSWLDGYKPKGK